MRSLERFAVCFLLLLLAACGGGGIGNVPNPGDSSGNGNPPAADPNSLSLGDLQITSPHNSAVVARDAQIHTNAEKISGVNKIIFYADDSLISSGPKAFCSWNTLKVANGTHTIKVEAQSSHGNAIDTVKVKVDNKKPVWASGHNTSRTVSSVGDPVIDYVSPTVSDDGTYVDLAIHGSNLTPTQKVRMVERPHCGGLGEPWIGGTLNFKEISSTLVVAQMYFGPVWDNLAVELTRLDGAVAVKENAHERVAVAESYVIYSVLPYWEEGTGALCLDIRGCNLADKLLSSEPVGVVGKEGYGWAVGIRSQSDSRIITKPLSELRVGDPYWVLMYFDNDPKRSVSGVALWSGFLASEGGGDQQPTVDAQANPTTGVSPVMVSFHGTAQSNNDGGLIVEYRWDFDNNGSIDAYEQDSQYTYVLPNGVNSKVYTAKLTAYDSFGQSASDTVQIIVNAPEDPPLPPSINPVAVPNDGTEPLTVQFHANAVAGEPGASIVDCRWDFDNNGTWDSYSTDPTHTFYVTGLDQSQTYSVALQATDSLGQTIYGCVGVTVRKTQPITDPPTASIKYEPASPVISDYGAVVVHFTANAGAPSGYIASYDWSINSNGQWLHFGYGASADWHFGGSSVPGTLETWLIRLRVTDNLGQAAETFKTVDIKCGTPPVAGFNYYPSSSMSPVDCTFVSAAQVFDGASVVEDSWDFENDGNIDASGSQVTHTYTIPLGMTSRTFTVVHRVRDSLGRTGYDTASLQVMGPEQLPPIVLLDQSNVEGYAPFTWPFNVSATCRSGGVIAVIVWSVNGIDQNGGSRFNYTFNQPGAYTVSVRVFDSYGLVGFATATVTAYQSSGGGGGGADPDLPPITIQGADTSNTYGATQANIGQGAPNETVRQAFVAAFNRAKGDAGKATGPMYYQRSGYVQDLYGGAAGSGAIMMLDGQSQAAWIHGDIYRRYIALSGPNGYLGFPLQDEAIGGNSAVTGAQCAYTLFSGDGYAQAQLIYHRTGAYQYQVYEVRGAIYNQWKAMGGNRSSLGLPTSNQCQWNGGWRSDFEGGYIFCNSAGQVSVNGTGGGGGGNGGGSGGSNPAQLIQQKRNSIPTSQIGSPVTGTLSATWGKFGSFNYQLFAGGSGWVGALVYNPARGQVFYVQGAICRFWWYDPNTPAAINGVQCYGVGAQVGLPISDESNDASGGGNRRSDFTDGYIVWAKAQDQCSFHYYSDNGPPPIDWSSLLTLLVNWFDQPAPAWLASTGMCAKIGECIDSVSTTIDLADSPLSPGPDLGLLVIVRGGIEKKVETYKVARKIMNIEGEVTSEEMLGPLAKLVRRLEDAGHPFAKDLMELEKRLPSSVKARLYGLQNNDTLMKGVADFIEKNGYSGVSFFEDMLRRMPDTLSDLASIDLNPSSFRGILEYHRLSVDKLGLDQLVGNAIHDGQVFFGRVRGSGARRILIHNRSYALIEIDTGYPTPKVVNILQNADPYYVLNASYTDIVQVR